MATNKTYIVKHPHSVEYDGKLYLPGEPLEIDDKEAERLLKKNRVEMPMAGEEIIAKTPAPDKMSTKELKLLLDELKVPYGAKAKKDELVELVNTATATPPVQE